LFATSPKLIAGNKDEGFKMLADVAKLSAGGEEYRVPPTTTPVETTPPAKVESDTNA